MPVRYVFWIYRHSTESRVTMSFIRHEAWEDRDAEDFILKLVDQFYRDWVLDGWASKAHLGDEEHELTNDTGRTKPY